MEKCIISDKSTTKSNCKVGCNIIVNYCKCISQTAISKGRIQKNSSEIRPLTKGAPSEGESLLI